MTQDKAPDWHAKVIDEAYRLAGDSCKVCQLDHECNGFECRIAFNRGIALVLFQAYERGQESMRGRAAQVANVVAGRQPNSMGMTGYEAGSAKAANEIAKAIRSLPIEQAGGK